MNKKIILDQDNFKNFFSPVGPLHVHHDKHLWPYNYVDRDSDTLLVTIGDSWTWGYGINYNNNNAIDITEQEDKFRTDHIYGNLISKEKNWNWLNLGFYAQGNQWMANKVFELRGMVPFLDFKNVIVMVVLTGTARWFHTWQDGLEDYKGYFQNNVMTKAQDYENFMIGLNRKIIDQITHLTNSEKKIRLLVGTNNVDHCGFDSLREEQIIPLPWYRLLTDTALNGIYVDIESLKGLPYIENYLTNEQKFEFQKWMTEKMDQAEKQTAVIAGIQDPDRDGFHPTHKGHRKWADYILQKIL
jgi:hypothetical protein